MQNIFEEMGPLSGLGAVECFMSNYGVLCRKLKNERSIL